MSYVLQAHESKKTSLEEISPFEVDLIVNKYCKDLTLKYPPTDRNTILDIIDYKLSNKLIPAEYKLDLHDFSEKSFVPLEKACHRCKSKLISKLINRNATVLTKYSLTRNNKTYYKMCNSCNMVYNYQEITDGVHNFNDSFLLGFDVCTYIRYCLCKCIPIGNAISVLLDELKESIHVQLVMDAYYHYEALCDHDYEFACVQCGYHPVVVITDVNQKVAYRYNINNLEPPRETSDENDMVDADVFWKQVHSNMIGKGIISKDLFDIKPSYRNWAPVMGRHTRLSAKLFNSEYRKVNSLGEIVDVDTKEMTEERLIDMLSSTKKNIKAIAASIGIKQIHSLTKFQVIEKIRMAMHGDQHLVRKVFSKLGGFSGGWLAMVCPHGVSIAMKFIIRAEGARDHIDIIKSMKHQPNVCINDCAHIISAHGNNREPGTFGPFGGRLVDDTPSNIARAERSQLSVSLSFLSEKHQRSGTNVPVQDNQIRAGSNDAQQISVNVREPHPISGSNQYFCLLDEFHKFNIMNKAEILRWTTLCPELRGQVSTPAAEQMFSAKNKLMFSLNKMNPQHHVFMFRLLMNCHNNRKNREVVNMLSKKVALHQIHRDEYGRVYFDLEQHTQFQQSADCTMNDDYDNTNEELLNANYDDDDNDVYDNNDSIDDNDENDGYDNNDGVNDKYDNAGIGVNDGYNGDIVDNNEDDDDDDYEDDGDDKDDDDDDGGGGGDHDDDGADSFNEYAAGDDDSDDDDDDNDDDSSDDDVEEEDKEEDVSDDDEKEEVEGEEEREEDEEEEEQDGNSDVDLDVHCDSKQDLTDVFTVDKLRMKSGKDMTLKIMIFFLKHLPLNPTIYPIQPVVMYLTIEDHYIPVTSGKIVQVISLSPTSILESHWVVVSNYFDQDNEISIYDSNVKLHLNRRDASKISYPENLLKAIGELVQHKSETVTMKVRNVEQQRKNYMSGYFAILFAKTLLENKDPESLSVNEPFLKWAIVTCINNGFTSDHLDMPPKDSYIRTVLYKWTEIVYCHCKQFELSNLDMVECTSCKSWYHKECESGNFHWVDWQCLMCMKKRKVLKRGLPSAQTPQKREMKRLRQPSIKMLENMAFSDNSQ